MSLVTITGNVRDHGRKIIPASQQPELYFRPEASHVLWAGLMHGDSVKADLAPSGRFTVELESESDDSLSYIPWVRWLVDPSEPDAFGYYEFPRIWPDSGGDIGDLIRPSVGWVYCSPTAPVKSGRIRAEFQYNTTTTQLFRRYFS